jgi:hypothetical protein
MRGDKVHAKTRDGCFLYALSLEFRHITDLPRKPSQMLDWDTSARLRVVIGF